MNNNKRLKRDFRYKVQAKSTYRFDRFFKPLYEQILSHESPEFLSTTMKYFAQFDVNWRRTNFYAINCNKTGFTSCLDKNLLH